MRNYNESQVTQVLIRLILGTILIFMWVLIFGLPNNCRADSIYLGAYSVHVVESPYVNNSQHDLLAYEHNGWVVGTFRNSYDTRSEFVARRFDVVEWGYWELRANTGFVYGYNTCEIGKVVTSTDRKWCPIITPELQYTQFRVRPTLVMLGKALAVTVNIKF